MEPHVPRRESARLRAPRSQLASDLKMRMKRMPQLNSEERGPCLLSTFELEQEAMAFASGLFRQDSAIIRELESICSAVRRLQALLGKRGRAHFMIEVCLKEDRPPPPRAKMI